MIIFSLNVYLVLFVIFFLKLIETNGDVIIHTYFGDFIGNVESFS